MITDIGTISPGMFQDTVREVQARIAVYNDEQLSPIYTFEHDENLISFTVERVNEDGKFFGFGICQRVNFKLIDTDREIELNTGNMCKVEFGVHSAYQRTFPLFYISEVHRDENTNNLSVTAYDLIYKTSYMYSSHVELYSYTIEEWATQAALVLGCSGLELQRFADDDTCFSTYYEKGANFEGTESLRDALDAVAEATQSIYFIDYNEKLVFKKMSVLDAADLAITRYDYFALADSTNKRLTTLVHATELGDNVHATLGISGSTQYIRDNPFWDIREDVGDLVEAALNSVGPLTIGQFNCEWRGNPCTEPGDKFVFTTKDNQDFYSYLLNDTLEYDGALRQRTQWSYINNEAETASNPVTLGDALKQTFARVDKVNKQIDLVVTDNQINKETLTQIQLDTENITATVQQVQTNVDNSLGEINGELQDIKNRVDASMTAEDVKITIQETISAGGVDSVTTETGFTFNDSGLTIDKTDSEMKTVITEDGMTVYRNEDPVLIANNQGVNAANLHATTYLIIGKYSRFEDYINADGEPRTGCFWIGP